MNLPQAKLHRKQRDGAQVEEVDLLSDCAFVFSQNRAIDRLPQKVLQLFSATVYLPIRRTAWKSVS